MKWSEWLENWSMASLKISAPFLQMEWKPRDPDKNAAWEMYIELLTRITTQPLPMAYGDEKTALESVHKLFSITRETIRRHGRDCKEFSKIAIVILNQIIRPFTTKWHGVLVNNGFEDKTNCTQFRTELEVLRVKLVIYTRMLGQMAGVEEDLTKIENA